ncbi:anaerobic sulfatase maturase [Bacillus tamaricis]|uniref:Anaerobic sulfatase maturase n=2 Tax=Evansella tamaricis TaxID=2069301 RepID=A0ABS6JFZ6_9BACI|nr:anaerobic sulfatase maturase [Evansella tamaricis]MBU9712589.1 anaerobic sulfatase maturase [Evansella tamaricis]
MWKTVSESCNLICDYCYYRNCKGNVSDIDVIDDALLEKFIKEYMELTDGVASFVWQGGEPLLAGIDFFERVVQLQGKYAPPHTIISNSVQTNGTLIDQNWASFFKKYHFLVGVSLDGPKEINDQRRKTGSGSGSFHLIMNGIQHLKNAGVPFNILTVIHQGNVNKVAEVLKFFKEHQYHYLQFIPCMKFKAQTIEEPGKYEITPKEYGDFLCEVFDHWYNNGKPQFSERFFDSMLASYVVGEGEICTHRKTCPETLLLESNGEAYPCDFYIHSDFFLGNVREDSLTSILHKKKEHPFQKLKSNLPSSCQTCEFLHLCFGGCPRNRDWRRSSQDSEPDYFCESYKQVYRYTQTHLKNLSEILALKNGVD